MVVPTPKKYGRKIVINYSLLIKMVKFSKYILTVNYILQKHDILMLICSHHCSVMYLLALYMKWFAASFIGSLNRAAGKYLWSLSAEANEVAQCNHRNTSIFLSKPPYICTACHVGGSWAVHFPESFLQISVWLLSVLPLYRAYQEIFLFNRYQY